MKTKKIALWIVISTLVVGTYFLVKQVFFPPKKVTWYTVGKARPRDVSQIIRATGFLEAEDTLKIGSIVPGVIYKMLKEENDPVEKGELIAIIDDGKGDTEVRETAGLLEEAKSNLEYQTSYFNRQKVLYEAQQLSQDGFEKVTRDYKNALSSVRTRQAANDRAKLTFNNKKIRAPEAGIILAKVSTEGETVTLASPATIIYTIAKDIEKMKVKLEVDETTIGNLKVGEKAYLTFDTYPNKRFIGTIQKISNAPIFKKGAVSYEASFILDNTERMLRPGMTVNARIIVGEQDDVLTLPGYAFSINPKLLEAVAHVHGFTVKQIDKETREELMQKGTFNTVWVKEGNTFVEKAVEIGLTDNSFFEIKSGLTPDDEVVMDIHEPDSLEELYGRIFGKGL